MATANTCSLKKSGKLASILFPAWRIRFSIALALTFFPCGLMYPLEYPVPELIMLSAWLWALPSTIGYLAFVLAPLISTETYGYYSFNLFCVVVNLAIAYSASRSQIWKSRDFEKIHKLARTFMVLTLIIAGLQIVTDQYAWMTVFPHMSLEPGRGAGLRLEPSQIASLLCLYLIALVSRREVLVGAPGAKHARKALFIEAILVMIFAIAETRSITVLIITGCFLPPLISFRSKRLVPAAIALLASLLVVYAVLGDRIDEATQTSGGSVTEFVTTSLGSWRNTPDVVILTSPADFLLPGNPGDVRLKIHDHAVMLSPLLGWLQNTFTLFSASAITLGLPLTVLAFVLGLGFGMKGLKGADQLKLCWVQLYVTAWFIVAKWDTTCWVALGMLPLVSGWRRKATPCHTIPAPPAALPIPLAAQNINFTAAPLTVWRKSL